MRIREMMNLFLSGKGVFLYTTFSINDNVNLIILRNENYFNLLFAHNQSNVPIEKINSLYSYKVSLFKDSNNNDIIDDSSYNNIDEYIKFLNNQFLNDKLQNKLPPKGIIEKKGKI